MVKMSKPNSISIQQAIQEAEREVERFVDAESDPMLRAILQDRIDLSISNIADSIEKNYLGGLVIKRSDGSIDPSQSTITSDHLEFVRYSLEKTKKEYLSRYDHVKNPADLLVIDVQWIITSCSIREEWDSWATKQQLLADEAIPLMNGLDPRSWKEYQNEEKNLPLEMVDSIERCLKMAESDGLTVKPPTEWIIWGRKHDLDKPILTSNTSNIPNVCMFKLFETAVNAVSKSSNALKPNQSDKQEINKPKTNNIPGTIPRIAIGQLTVTEAWEIEREKGKRATAKEVLEKLQAWATNGQKYCHVLHPPPDKFRGSGVYWITGKSRKKLYTLVACEKALEKWNKSRQ